jgi:hypothetical protein
MNAQSIVLAMIAAVVVSFSAGAGAERENSESRPVDATQALNTAQRWAALISQPDIAGLDELLHAEYLHIHATALVESKEKFIDAFKTGARKYDPVNFDEARVRVFGDSAIVTGRFALRAMSRGKVIEGTNRFGLLLVRTPRGLQVAAFQATPIPPQK